MDEISNFIDFLLDAKMHTYAANTIKSTNSLLPGSTQFEYSDGLFMYRDIYFGSAYFVGQETVYADEKPYWSMCYAGGVHKHVTGEARIKEIYSFLRNSMLRIDKSHVFRGPDEMVERSYKYRNSSTGDIYEFNGNEAIWKNSQPVYSLRYSGGMIR
ncbi:MAG: DUF5680 domain-containing protein [Thermoplasmataceae archaeon]